jgi:hypothetical protein
MRINRLGELDGAHLREISPEEEAAWLLGEQADSEGGEDTHDQPGNDDSTAGAWGLSATGRRRGFDEDESEEEPEFDFDDDDDFDDAGTESDDEEEREGNDDFDDDDDFDDFDDDGDDEE